MFVVTDLQDIFLPAMDGIKIKWYIRLIPEKLIPEKSS